MTWIRLSSITAAIAIAVIGQLVGCGPDTCAPICKPPLEPSRVLIVAHEGGVTAVDLGTLKKELLCTFPVGIGSSALPVVREGGDGRALVLGVDGTTICDGGRQLRAAKLSAPETWRVESPSGKVAVIVDECAMFRPWAGRECRGLFERTGGEQTPLGRPVNMDANAPMWLDDEAVVYRDANGQNVIEDLTEGTVQEVGQPGWVVVSATEDGSELFAHDAHSVFVIERAGSLIREILAIPGGIGDWVIVSPDKRFVVYSRPTLRPERHNVYVSRPDDGSTCRLAEGWRLRGGYWSRGDSGH